MDNPGAILERDMATYDSLAQFYYSRRADTSRFDYNRDIEVPGMIAAIGDVSGLRVLDEGCGFGDHLGHLAASGPEELFGIDSSEELIKFARQQDIPNAKLLIHDLNNPLPFEDDHFDIIFSSLTVFYVHNLQQLFAENYRVLKPGERFLFSIFHPVLMLMNTSSKAGIIGTRRGSSGSLKIYGNYFDESLREANMGSLGKIRIYPYTIQTYFDALNAAGFQIESYCDLRPVPRAKKHEEKYQLTTTLPTFVLITAKKPATDT